MNKTISWHLVLLFTFVVSVFSSAQTQIERLIIPNSFDILNAERGSYHTRNSENPVKQIAFCKEHWPRGSQARENFEEVISFLNSMPYFRLSFEISEINHVEEEDIFSCPPTIEYDLYVDFFENSPMWGSCNSLEPYHSSAAFIANYSYGPDYNYWSWGLKNKEYPMDRSVMFFNVLDNYGFPEYYANMSLDNMSPSKGVIIHEIGHWLHMDHNEMRAALREPVNFQAFDHFCNARGGFCRRLTQQDDTRIPHITAYARAILDRIYPMEDFQDYKQEFSIHDIFPIPQKHSQDSVAWFTARHYSEYVNTIKMHLNGDHYTDCLSRKDPIALIHFSDASGMPLSAGTTIDVAVMLEELDGSNQKIVALEKIPLETVDDYGEYRVRIPFELTSDILPASISSRTMRFRYVLDPFNEYDEYDEKNNELTLEVIIEGVGQSCSFQCPCKGPSFNDASKFFHDNDGQNWVNEGGWLRTCDPCDDGTGKPWKGVTCHQHKAVRFEIPSEVSATESTIIESITVSPNPVSNQLFISEKIEHVEVFSIDGKQVFPDFSNGRTIDVSNLRTGMYFIKLRNKGKLYLSKFLKL